MKAQSSAWPYKLSLVSVSGYIFFYPLVHNAAGKNIFALLMIAALAVMAVREPGRLYLLMTRPGWALGSVIALFAIAGLSSTLAVSPAESWGITAKQIGIQLVVCVLTALMLNGGGSRNIPCVRILALAIAAGLALRVMVVGQEYFFSEFSGLPGAYTKGYATMAAMIIPLVLATLLAWRWPLPAFIGLVLLLLGAFWLILDYPTKSRASLYSLLAGVLVMLAASRRWKGIAVTAVVIVAGIFAVSQASPGTLDRYGSVFQKFAYQGDGASGRFSIWVGTLDLIRERPWLGYGPGWKKLPAVAAEGGHIDRWQSSDDPLRNIAAQYFSQQAGKVNPHNLYLQVIFEIGLAGLAALLSLAVAILIQGWKVLRQKENCVTPSAMWFGLASAGFIVSWLVGGIANGFWSDLTPLFILAGVARGLELDRDCIRDRVCEENPHNKT